MQMIKANIEAQIENKYKEREKVRTNILKLDRLIDTLKKSQRMLLDEETELCMIVTYYINEDRKLKPEERHD